MASSGTTLARGAIGLREVADEPEPAADQVTA